MQTTLKRLIKLTAGYSLVTLIGPLFTILLFPLYTRVLEPADYGIVEKALTFHSLLSIFVTMGMDQALSAYFFTGDQAFRRNLVTTAVISVSVVSIVIAVLVALFANKIAQILFQSVEYSTLVYLIALLLISAPLYGLTASALRLNMGIKLVNTLGFSYLLSFVTCNIIFVLILRWNATGIVAANAIANLLSASVGLYLIYKPLLGRFSLSIARSLAISGFGLIPGVLGSVMLANIDHLLPVKPYVTNSEIALYGIVNNHWHQSALCKTTARLNDGGLLLLTCLINQMQRASSHESSNIL